jgi:hypothetical protein
MVTAGEKDSLAEQRVSAADVTDRVLPPLVGVR